MCMYRPTYVKLDKKEWVENMRSTTLEVAMLADVSGANSAILSVYQCVTGPL